MKKVRIYKQHTHAGIKYTPGPDGIDIEVSDTDADFLKKAGVLDKPAAAPVAPAAASH